MVKAIIASIISIVIWELFVKTVWKTFLIQKLVINFWGLIDSLFGGKLPKTKSIKSSIETYLNEEIKSSSSRAFGSKILIDDKIRIEWVRVESEESVFPKEGEIIIRLGYNMDEIRNYVEAVMRYLDYGFIPSAKPYIDTKLFTALKIQFIHQTMIDRGREAFRYYNEHYLAKELNIKEIMGLLEKTNVIKQKGFFLPILLREINELSDKLARGMKVRTTQLDEEVYEFVDFLYNISNKENYEKEHGGEPPLNFIRRYIKVAVILVKSREKQDIGGHKARVESNFREGANCVYIAGLGKNAENALDVYKLALSAYRDIYCLKEKGCVDIEVIFEDKVKKEGKICLIERSYD